MSSSLFNVEIEAHVIGLLLQHPEVWGDFYLNDRNDFSAAHKPLYDILSLHLNSTPPKSVAPIMLADGLKGLGVTTLEGGFGVLEYTEGLLTRYVEAKDSTHLARELKRLTVRRQLIDKMEGARKELVGKPGATFEEMTQSVERNLTAVNTDYYQAEVFEPVFGDIVEANEKRAANPLDASKMGWMGPFESVNKTLGSIISPHMMCVIGARTGGQKSAIGFAYHVDIAERLGVRVLLLDCGEMTRERIRDRAACLLSKGRVPLWAIKSGEWAQNKEWARILREECWPRVEKLSKLFDYINIGHLSPREKVTLLRRYYYNKVGRGNQFAILDDYIKGVEGMGRNIAEHQAVGYYVNDVKNLITNEIPASFWSSVQNNRSGVFQGKAAKDITDSEDQMGLSDRIIQQADWGFILRWKVPEELGAEKELFGNMRLTPVKTREALGRDFEKALRPVKLPNGKFVTNFFHLQSRGFAFTDMGDLRKSLEVLGNAQVDLGPDDPTIKKVQPL